MSGPDVSFDSPQAPIPILVGFSRDEHGRIERTWNNAPSIVRDGRVLAVLGIVLNFALVVVAIFGLMVTMLAEHPEGHRMVGVPGSVIFLQLCALVFYIALIALQIWLISGLRLGERSAWTTELILATIGLIGFPIGTLIGVYVLTKWSQPDTKHWFGFDV